MPNRSATPEQRESILNPHRVIVTTGTMYSAWYEGPVKDHKEDNDKVRGDLALQTLAAAKKKGYQLVVIDGGSCAPFLEAIEELEVSCTSQKSSGMSNGRQQGFQAASELDGAEIIVWVEPEKVSFIEDGLDACIAAIDAGTDIVIPKRDEDAWQSYPKYQQESEQRANKHWNTVLSTGISSRKGQPGFDVFFGPRVFKCTPRILKHFLRNHDLQDSRLMSDRFMQAIDPGRYSNATFFPIATALQDGLDVRGVTVSYNHPQAQVVLESDNKQFNEKRVKQRRDIVGGLVRLLVDVDTASADQT